MPNTGLDGGCVGTNHDLHLLKIDGRHRVQDSLSLSIYLSIYLSVCLAIYLCIYVYRVRVFAKLCMERVSKSAAAAV